MIVRDQQGGCSPAAEGQPQLSPGGDLPFAATVPLSTVLRTHRPRPPADGRHVPRAVDAMARYGLGDLPTVVDDQQAPGLGRGAGAVHGRQASDHHPAAPQDPQRRREADAARAPARQRGRVDLREHRLLPAR
jgi:hypothetical protein